jgi:A/G-specific adenine glycosylase
MAHIQEYQKRFFTQRMMEWGSLNLRNYPWRNFRNTYRVLISEIFLQRTKADQVEKVYSNFIKIAPTQSELNIFTKQYIESIFNSLGLIKRVEIFWNCIQKIINSKNSLDDFKENALNDLPGIGKYSLNAILCFGRGSKRSIVDSNIIRIFSRFFAYQSNKSQPRYDPELWNFAQNLLPEDNYIEYNYALIDFGALICTARNPKCIECLLAKECKYLNNNPQTNFTQ